MNDRCHLLAKQIIGKDRKDYVKDYTSTKLNDVLNANKQFMDGQRKLLALKLDPSKKRAVKEQQDHLRALSDKLSDFLQNTNLEFIDPQPEGI